MLDVRIPNPGQEPPPAKTIPKTPADHPHPNRFEEGKGDIEFPVSRPATPVDGVNPGVKSGLMSHRLRQCQKRKKRRKEEKGKRGTETKRKAASGRF